jgi:hypothetical protein
MHTMSSRSRPRPSVFLEIEASSSDPNRRFRQSKAWGNPHKSATWPNLAIDGKLRGCDVVAVKVDDIAPNGYCIERATRRTRRPACA